MVDFLIILCAVCVVTSLAGIFAMTIAPYVELINEFFSDERNDA